ncbi:MAG: indoleamine 2,3-dioxygenase [Gemmatimonadota bacterium]
MLPALTLHDLSAYDVDPVRGFLPVRDPLERLPAPYEAWDELARALPGLLVKQGFREAVARLPLLDPAPLEGPELARAMLLLCMFANAYVWESAPPAPRIPQALAVPLCRIAERLGRPPIVAHASLVLANWRRIDPEGPLDPENLDTLVTFVDIDDEKWFYLLTVGIEATGGAAIPIMIEAQAAAERGDIPGLTSRLEALAAAMHAVTDVLGRMYERCSPAAFYRQVRPWLTGWTEPGVVYEGVSETPHRLTGGSAAQSPLIQAFDAVLGVAHPSPASGPFLLEMRGYMRPVHRRFVERLEQGPSIAGLVGRRGAGALGEPEPGEEGRALRSAYNACIEELDKFRKGHLEMAARYITMEAKGDPAAKGTGGTDFGAFLGAARRETLSAKTPLE